MNDHDFKLRLIDGWQRDFPLTEKPFSVLADESGASEQQVLASLHQMFDEGVLTRVGAVVRPNTVGASTLAAMKVSPADLVDVADIVNAEPGVNHNYEREHDYNLWFVVTASDKGTLADTLQRISMKTGIEILSLPLQKAHHIDLGFALGSSPHAGQEQRKGILPPPTMKICEEDRQLLAMIEDGLPLVSTPYAHVARQMGLDESEVIERLARLIDGLVISRFGLVVRHRKMGYTANAMAVWDIGNDDVDALGDLLASRPFVTLCYQRFRARPGWPYNLFCMIHGNERSRVLKQIDELNQLVAGRAAGHTVLFSKNCFKQRGARFSSPGTQDQAQKTRPSIKQSAQLVEFIHA
jgi:DNA-binding Lrp family transcriptional regulator